MRQVVISMRAAGDLEDTGDYIAVDNPAKARRFISDLRERCLGLSLHPFRGEPAAEIGLDVRMPIVGNDLVLYRMQAEAVMIDRIVHSARDITGLSDDM